MNRTLPIAGALAVLAGIAVVLFVNRSAVMNSMPQGMRDWIRQTLLGYRIEKDVRIAISDGVRLANDVYFPRGAKQGRHPTVLIRLPYNKRTYGEAREMGEFFASHGYITVVQDFRGTSGSEGQYRPFQGERRDTSETLDWIVRQAWSNGRVGTFGCSALGETQMVLAAARHPAHAAMISLADGGALGVVPGRVDAFGWYEGGIFNLASGFGWFLEHGGLDPSRTPPSNVDVDAAIWGLPSGELMRRHRSDATGYERFLTTPLSDPAWARDDFVSADDHFATPALQITTWQDQAVDATLAMSLMMNRDASVQGAANRNHVIIAPGNHCNFLEVPKGGRVADLAVGPESYLPYASWYLAWFDHWLRGQPLRLALPPYLLYVTGEDKWVESSQWPLPDVSYQRWNLQSQGHANSWRGDGVLSLQPPTTQVADSFRYDPAHPVPTRGGPFCCTANPALRPGPVDQREVEERDDVLVYSSPALAQGVRVLGPIEAELTVMSDAPDTDIVAKLVDVDPAGVAINVQEGALRLRFRDGLQHPQLMQPGKPYTVRVPMRALGHYFKAGHRIRLQVTSSNFPRLERNLNTGGRNFDEATGRVANNTVLHGPGAPSALILPVLEKPQYFAAPAP